MSRVAQEMCPWFSPLCDAQCMPRCATRWVPSVVPVAVSILTSQLFLPLQWTKEDGHRTSTSAVPNLFVPLNTNPKEVQEMRNKVRTDPGCWTCGRGSCCSAVVGSRLDGGCRAWWWAGQWAGLSGLLPRAGRWTWCVRTRLVSVDRPWGLGQVHVSPVKVYSGRCVR